MLSRLIAIAFLPIYLFAGPSLLAGGLLRRVAVPAADDDPHRLRGGLGPWLTLLSPLLFVRQVLSARRSGLMLIVIVWPPPAC
jgi:hypothetical protein